ncbi:hypothetical protein BU120_05345 [Staphylococcus xylosus]|nr:hypothetical protein BU120_05345 [Staphylococcus xylosus]
MDKILLKEQIENLYNDILINLGIEQIPKYFAEDYIQITDHKVSNIDEFKNHERCINAFISKHKNLICM